MSLTNEEVEHIAHLARLDLSAEEKKRYQKQLSSILGHIEKLQALDTENVEPIDAVVADKSRLRQDVAGECLTSNELLNNAPSHKNNQFRVPPVLDDGSA